MPPTIFNSTRKAMIYSSCILIVYILVLTVIDLSNNQFPENFSVLNIFYSNQINILVRHPENLNTKKELDYIRKVLKKR